MDLSKCTITGPDGRQYRLIEHSPSAKLSAPHSEEPAAKFSLSELITMLGAYKVKNKISWREVARRVGVENATLIDLRKGRKQRPHRVTIDAITRLVTDT